MVTGNTAKKLFAIEKSEIDYTFLPEPIKFTSVSLSDIKKNKTRLEASAFNLDAEYAFSLVKNSRYGYDYLLGQQGLIKDAFVRPRFKRIYAGNINVPIYLPSSIVDVYPKPSKYISAKTATNISELKVVNGMLLLTVSGTIGKCTLVTKTLQDKVFSHDLMRIICKNNFDSGYIYTYFQTKTGQTILQSNNYGAVIQHIEPEHLQSVIIPKAPESLKKEINELIIESFDLRDQSNELIDKAEKILYDELHLPLIDELKSEYFESLADIRNFSVKLSNINNRFDCSYHTPKYLAILEHIKKNSGSVKFFKDNSIAKSIILPGRFKRTYVESEEYGIKFIGGKQINELNPSSEKYLSNEIHKTRLGEELLLKENCILITRSGTIGKVSIVPKHWESWAANEHIIRVFPSSDEIAGYIYCWLNSDYGLELIKKHTYGSVVDEIDTNHVGDVPIPLLKNESKQKEINDLVLKANKLRYEAHLKEEEAIKMVEEIINTKRMSVSS